jgi:hypothetical protein
MLNIFSISSFGCAQLHLRVSLRPVPSFIASDVYSSPSIASKNIRRESSALNREMIISGTVAIALIFLPQGFSTKSFVTSELTEEVMSYSSSFNLFLLLAFF